MTNTTFKQLLNTLDHKDARLIAQRFTNETSGFVYVLWRGEYVTWAFAAIDGTVSFFWGHYHGNNEDAAIADFNYRASNA